MATQQLPPEWTHWVEENIVRGVLENQLIDILVEHQFDQQLAVQSVTMIASQHRPKGEDNLQGAAGAQTGTVEPTCDPFQYLRLQTCQIIAEVEKPRILVLSNALSYEECDCLIEMAKPRLQRSMTVNDQTGGSDYHEARTSRGMFFKLNENKIVSLFDHRAAQFIQFPIENGEGMQLVRYGIGEEYRPHFDYFPPEKPGSAKHLQKGGQRAATVLFYLNTVEEGGETIFPEIGFKVKAVKGNAVIFYNCTPEGKEDPLTRHGGAPVIRGEKWIVNKWFRYGKFE